MDRRSRLCLALAGISGFAGVAAGAFGAHGASDARAKALLETGGHYELVHALAALAAVWAWREGLIRSPTPAWLFLSGSALFAFSLYALAIGAPTLTGAITPIGGVLLLAGWAWLAICAAWGGAHTRD